MIPEFVKNLFINDYSIDTANKIINGLKKKKYSSFRVNNIKSSCSYVEKELINNNISYEKVKGIDNAYIILDNTDISNLDIYKNGFIYVQSISSQLPPLYFELSKNNVILDMASAPGGKVTEIASLLNNEASIIACEPNKVRFDRLNYNLNMQGVTCVNSMNIDALKLDDYFSFDKILLDAPCSGSGCLDSSSVISTKLINNSSILQKKLIKKAINMLKVGGELIYSTCSINKCENEDVIFSILSNGNMEVVDITNYYELEHITYLDTKIKGAITIMPNEYYEGFFVCKLRKIKK